MSRLTQLVAELASVQAELAEAPGRQRRPRTRREQRPRLPQRPALGRAPSGPRRSRRPALGTHPASTGHRPRRLVRTEPGAHARLSPPPRGDPRHAEPTRRTFTDAPVDSPQGPKGIPGATPPRPGEQPDPLAATASNRVTPVSTLVTSWPSVESRAPASRRHRPALRAAPPAPSSAGHHTHARTRDRLSPRRCGGQATVRHEPS
jgi:hypothetical protein